jgi:hypothetical protein
MNGQPIFDFLLDKKSFNYIHSVAIRPEELVMMMTAMMHS